MEEISGGMWCDTCAKCLTSPRKHKNFRPPYYYTCEDCVKAKERQKNQNIKIIFKVRPEAIITEFKVHFKDIDKLIEVLKDYQTRTNTIAPKNKESIDDNLRS